MFQKYSCEGRVSQQIDDEYEDIRAQQHQTHLETENNDTEESFVMSDHDVMDPDATLNSTSSWNLGAALDSSSFSWNIIMHHSGAVHISDDTVDTEEQQETVVPDHPKLRKKKRVCTNKIKSICAMVSSTCGVSAEMPRKIVKIVAK